MNRALRCAALVAAVVVSLSVAAAAHGSLTPVATLSAAGEQMPFTEFATSEGTFVASGLDVTDVFTEPAGGWLNDSQPATLSEPEASLTFGAESLGGEIVVSEQAATGLDFDDVFVEPPGGWSGTVPPAATLVAPDGGNLSAAAFISASAIVAVGYSYDERVVRPSLYVFTEPAGGWSGTVHEAARLTDSAGAPLPGEFEISGQTVFALAYARRSLAGIVDVFTEPAGGWSGTVDEAARLTDSAGALLYSGFAPSGRSVFAVARRAYAAAGRVDVFTEPAGGWSGTVHESATLFGLARPLGLPGGSPISPVDPAGSSVLAGALLFTEPPGGWTGRIEPVAGVYSAFAYEDVCGEAFSGTGLAISSCPPAPDHGCPCRARVSLFTEPADGWSGTITAPPAIATTSQSGTLPVALEGHYLFTAGASTVQVYDLTGGFGSRVRPPSVSSARVSGLPSGAPELAFTVRTGIDDPPLEALTLTLPHGLSLTMSHTRLRPGVSIAGAGDYALSVRHGALLVHLTRSGQRLHVEIRPRVLTESLAMISQARRLIERDHHKAVVALRANLHTTDSAGYASTSIVKFLAP